MFNMKKAMAVAMTVALMVPSTAFAATPSVQKTQLGGNYSVGLDVIGNKRNRRVARSEPVAQIEMHEYFLSAVMGVRHRFFKRIEFAFQQKQDVGSAVCRAYELFVTGSGVYKGIFFE